MTTVTLTTIVVDLIIFVNHLPQSSLFGWDQKCYENHKSRFYQTLVTLFGHFQNYPNLREYNQNLPDTDPS